VLLYKYGVTLPLTIQIHPGGAAELDGQLQLRDVIIRVDDVDFRGIDHSSAVSVLQQSVLLWLII
jgi:hypothetical protein